MQVKIRSDKENFCSITLSKFIRESLQKFWQYLGSKNNPPTVVSVEEELIKANSFNTYFQSVFTANNGKNTPLLFQDKNLSTLSVPQLSEPGLLSLLLNIDGEKGCGPDRIPNAFLKRYAESVCKYLFLIFSKSLKDCQVPSEWKIAKTLPIHKSGDSSCPSNYRPISITCSFRKMLEHIILKSLTEYVEENAILHSNQHGFRRGLSTVT